MPFFQKENSGYSLVDSDGDSEVALEQHQRNPKRIDRNPWSTRLKLLCLVVCVFAIGLTIRCFLPVKPIIKDSAYNPDISASLACKNATTRREWRSLSLPEKHHYLDSVSCLRTKPSKLFPNSSLYNDFPWVHSRIGEYSHMSAPFLAWHRYFIHIYETTLKEECGFQGSLTYWDWVLDWEDIPNAPVWSVEHGFGGDGDPSVGEDILRGHCVVEGPFAGLEVEYLGQEQLTHCLSRGFEKGDGLHEHGTWLQPAALERLLRGDDYEAFNIDLEKSAHNAIPRSIGGDFQKVTAPYDPVFFLHHTQLDRLWWTWQTRDPEPRMWQYRGRAGNYSSETASLDDILPMGGLAPDIPVSDIIKTEGDTLCYRY